MKIILRPHLKIRLAQRLIPQDYPKKIIFNPEEKYLDTATNHKIAVKRMEYNDKIRPMALAYDIIGSEIQVITIHPTSKQEIKNKLNRGRWVKNEES